MSNGKVLDEKQVAALHLQLAVRQTKAMEALVVSTNLILAEQMKQTGLLEEIFDSEGDDAPAPVGGEPFEDDGGEQFEDDDEPDLSANRLFGQHCQPNGGAE